MQWNLQFFKGLHAFVSLERPRDSLCGNRGTAWPAASLISTYVRWQDRLEIYNNSIRSLCNLVYSLTVLEVLTFIGTVFQADVSFILAFAQRGLEESLVDRETMKLSDSSTAILAIKQYTLYLKLIPYQLEISLLTGTS